MVSHQGNHGRLTAPLALRHPMGPVFFRHTGGAVGGDGNVLGQHARPLQALGVEALQVQMELSGGKNLDELIELD